MKKAYVSGLIDGFRIATNVGLLDLPEEEIMGMLFSYNAQCEKLEECLISETLDKGYNK